MSERKIINNIIEPKKYHSNKISTSKYTCINFIPKNLLEQFQKLANVYFLIIGFLQMVQQISISQGQPVIFLPLFVILCISALKDLFEDLKRHRSDDEENKRLISVYRKEMWIQTYWQDLVVGEIIKVMKDEYIPADIICLFSSDQSRICYIETKNLDGETNLKRKQAHKELQKYGPVDVLKANLEFNLEKPNPYLYNFQGHVQIDDQNGSPQQISLDINNFILRGSSVRNTDFVIGIVVYTGNDSKIMLNSIKARPKRSKVEKTMNIYIACIFLLQLLICFGSSLYSTFWFRNNKQYLMGYLGISTTEKIDNSLVYLFTIQWGTWVLIFTNFVPISIYILTHIKVQIIFNNIFFLISSSKKNLIKIGLLVTLEMVKFMQGIRISKDEQTYSTTNEIECTVQSSSLNEELGQVEYVFSDKTGTLTNNVMNFKCITVNGISYGEKSDISSNKLNSLPKVTNVQFKDNSLFTDLEQKNNQQVQITQSLLMLSICHTVIVEKTPYGIQYNAASPDELALINFAKFCGFEYIGIDEENIIKVKQGNQMHRFKLLHILEFNSTRKRMSLIVQNSKGQIVIYTKGADNILFSRLDQITNSEISILQTKKNLENYAKVGLRTLLLTYRIIPQEYYDKWNDQYNKALCLLTNRQEAVEEIQNEIEQNLSLLGATAIDDMLQDDVANTIQFMKEAGIKVWVLTGDKVETAINIAFSCALLNMDLQQLLIDGQTKEEIEKLLEDFHKQVESEKEKLILSNKEYQKSQNMEKICLPNAVIITGDALIHSMADQKLSKILIKICSLSKVVLACRVSPKQKQEMVSLVRHHLPHATTLAIGDGANDVNMITAAHVGIGIKGKEGQQAARASDFSIGEFKILLPLLFNHGRECYRKNTVLICYNFYKNMILVMPQWWYGFICGFSGSALYDPWIYQLYNMCYTSIPIVIYAIFDQEFSPNFLQRNASLYIQGIKGTLFNQKQFWEWILLGIWHALVCSFASFSVMENTFQEEGKQFFFAISGTVSFGASVLIGNLKILLFSNTHTVASIFFIFGSILFYISNYAFASGVFPSQDIYNTFSNTYGSPYFWFCNLVIVGITMSMDMGFERWYFYGKYKDMNIDIFEDGQMGQGFNSSEKFHSSGEQKILDEYQNGAQDEIISDNYGQKQKNIASQISEAQNLKRHKYSKNYDAIKVDEKFVSRNNTTSAQTNYYTGYAFSSNEGQDKN